mgnify:CR=1 FL=1
MLFRSSEPESSESHVDSDRCSTLILSSFQVGDNDQGTQSRSLPPTQPLVSLPLATSRNNPFVVGSYYWFHHLPPRQRKFRSNWRDADFFAGVVTSVSSKKVEWFWYFDPSLTASRSLHILRDQQIGRAHV